MKYTSGRHNSTKYGNAEFGKTRYTNLYVNFASLFSPITFLGLNSFWGRWGLNTNFPQSILVKNHGELIKYLSNDNLTINDIIDASDDMLLLMYHSKPEFLPIQENLSLIIAIFMTSHARTHLYQFLELVPPHQLLYFDTGDIFKFFFIMQRVNKYPFQIV